jgi:hypothetical protein
VGGESVMQPDGACARTGRRRHFGALSVVIFTSLALTSGCPEGERVTAEVEGMVIDAETVAPLVDVEVRSRLSSGRTDASGRYRLPVSRGLRELTYAAPGRASVRKLVVVRGPEAITLDVLVPREMGPRRRRLVFQRGTATDNAVKELPLETGDDTLVSIADDLGNDDVGFPVGHAEGTINPVWAASDEDAIYFGVRTFGPPGDRRFDSLGVYRYDLVTQQARRLWGGQYRDPDFVAVAPSGDAVVASTRQKVYLIEGLRSTPQETILYEATPVVGALLGGITAIAWAPQSKIHLSVSEPNTEGPHDMIIVKRRPSDAVPGAQMPLLASETDYFTDLVPLADGRLLYGYIGSDGSRRGIGLIEVDGSKRDLLPDATKPVSLEGGVLLYIVKDELHRRDLVSGLDLVIAQGTRWAAWRP